MFKFINDEMKLTKQTKEKEEKPITKKVKVTFDEPISKAFVVLRGWKLSFSEETDHHLAEVNVKVELENENIDGKEVGVKATVGIRDKDTFDDPYEGIVYFTVIGLPKIKITEMTIRYE
jgi:hypothetical protein